MARRGVSLVRTMLPREGMELSAWQAALFSAMGFRPLREYLVPLARW